MEKVLPDTQRLLALRDEGKTYRQISDWLLEKQGIRVTPGAVGAALSRAGVTAARERYSNHLPWTVRAEHNKDYAARMLRLLGRRDNGLSVTVDNGKRLDSWLNKLREEHALVAYLPDEYPEEGFVYVDGDWPADGIPIIRPHKGGEGARRY